MCYRNLKIPNEMQTCETFQSINLSSLVYKMKSNSNAESFNGIKREFLQQMSNQPIQFTAADCFIINNASLATVYMRYYKCNVNLNRNLKFIIDHRWNFHKFSYHYSVLIFNTIIFESIWKCFFFTTKILYCFKKIKKIKML